MKRAIINMSEGATQVRVDCDITGLSVGKAFDEIKKTCASHVRVGVTILESIYFYEEEAVRHTPWPRPEPTPAPPPKNRR